MLKSTLLLPFVGAGLSLLVAASAWAKEFQNCEIQYKIRLHPNPEQHVDTGPYSKQFSACVRSLSDCKARARALAQEREGAYRSRGDDNRPDLSSIRISRTHISGHCSELD